MGLTKEGEGQSGLGKLGRQGAICQFQKELSWRLYTSYFFRNKAFLFVKMERFTFQHLFDLELREKIWSVPSLQDSSF